MNKSKIIVFLSVFSLLLIFYFEVDEREYDIVKAREDDTYLVKNGNVVVGSTVVDYVFDAGFIYGVRFPIRYLQCVSIYGESSRIRVSKKIEYFIVNESSGEVLFFSDKLNFIEIASNFDLEPKLDSEIVDDFFVKYENIYKNDTVEILLDPPEFLKETNQCWDYDPESPEGNRSTK